MTLKTKSQANTNCSKSKKGEDQLVLSKVWHVSGRYTRQKLYWQIQLSFCTVNDFYNLLNNLII